ncbi:hypothetical protein MCOR25_009369 [Pyricularia grisea]|nr:hypothetical protein MCOR25_009369 [Pyricularia grisea]
MTGLKGGNEVSLVCGGGVKARLGFSQLIHTSKAIETGPSLLSSTNKIKKNKNSARQPKFRLPSFTHLLRKSSGRPFNPLWQFLSSPISFKRNLVPRLNSLETGREKSQKIRSR